MERPWYAFYDQEVPRALTYPIPIPNELFNRNTENHPDKPFLIFEDEKLSYRECNSMARRLANGLLRLGVKKGDRVTLMMPNIPQYPLSLLACYKIGAIAVPTNPQFTVHELTGQFADSGTETVVVTAAFADKVIKIRNAESTGVKRIIVVPYPGPGSNLESMPETYEFDSLLAENADQEPDIVVEMEDLAVLQYTGGTTGIPKGCMITQANMAVAANQVGIWYGAGIPSGQIRTLATIPLYHSYGRACNIDLSLFLAGTIVLVPQPTTNNILEAINKHEPNIWAAVPAMIHGIINHPDTGRSRIRSVKEVLSGGSPLAVEVLRKFEAMSGAPIIEGFGLSEVPYGIAYNPVNGVHKPGSVGVPMPNVDVRIVDVDTGSKYMPSGEPGEMIFKTPQAVSGYWNNPEETADVLRDGWLYTGDIGYMDKDGYIFIVDRKKDVLLCSGFNVYPREIDEVLYTNPKVLEACTIGVPDEKRGETVKSYVILKPGESMTEQELITYCRERLAPYKAPKILEFIGQLPRTSLGKPDRKALRALDEATRKQS
ncbi:MAG: long-chain fatty acid--CoA ligase [Desulfotomaculaceae bacterium]|nr:long-chain fatty acid--CoA ligase [Desulfotomaculaceae bacterium]